VSAQPIAVGELIRPEWHLFLSPHYDDIALSCGGTAALLGRHGRLPEVALIFGEEPDPEMPLTAFAESLHRDWGLDPARVIAGRRAEESAAARILGTRDAYLPFRDAIYRGERYTSNDVLFNVPAPEEAGLAAEIVAALNLDDREIARTRFYAPLAIGRHVDHYHGFGAGVELARRGGEVWFYEDLPYALGGSAQRERLGEIEIPLEVAAIVDVGASWTAKIDAIMAYPSQLATVFGYVGAGSTRQEIEEVMRAFASAVGKGVVGERFWRLGEG
jgi:LmbE family N-acetylglucosaminyl deacetylase